MTLAADVVDQEVSQGVPLTKNTKSEDGQGVLLTMQELILEMCQVKGVESE